MQKTSKVKLLAQRYDDDNGSGESWFNNWDVKYSDFTTYLPKDGDKLTFQLRGTINKQLDWFQLVLSSYNEKTETYKWYGGSSSTDDENTYAKIPLSFDQPLEITIDNTNSSYKGDPTQDDFPIIALQFVNFLWGKEKDGNSWHDSGTKLPKGAVNYVTVMAIFKNLEVRLLDITPKTP